jgi:hypothetical protein
VLPQVVPQIPQPIVAWLARMAMFPIGWLILPSWAIPPSWLVPNQFNPTVINSTTVTIQQIAATPYFDQKNLVVPPIHT